jgi:flagellar hook-associated protein 2
MSVIDGISSGLDTTGIINSLIAIEKQPINALNARIAAETNKASALQTIQSFFANINTASRALTSSTTFTATTATSSDTTRLGVTAAPGANPGNVSVRIHQLATTQQAMTATGLGSSATLTGAGKVAIASGLSALGATAITPDAGAVAGVQKLVITDAGGGQMVVTLGSDSVTVASNATTVSVGGLTMSFGNTLIPGQAIVQVAEADASTSVGSLVSMFNVTGGPASAQIINLGSTTPDRRVVFSADSSGTAGALLIGQSGLDTAVAAAFTGLSTITTAKDALVEIGDSGTMITRSTNHIDDLFQGITFDLAKADPAVDVTVSVAQDTTGIATKVKDWVTSINSMISQIATKTAYSATANTAGPLIGDSTVRSAKDQIVSAMTAVVGSGTYNSLTSIGISIQRDGTFLVDDTALAKALTADPTAVSSLLGQSGTATDAGVAFAAATSATKTGTYAVAITQAATRASQSGSVVSALTQAETLTVTTGTTSATINLASGTSASDILTALNASFLTNGLDATAELDTNGALSIRTNSWGSTSTLAIASSLGAGGGSTGFGSAGAGVATTSSGVDVQGTIDGQAATGKGQALTAIAGDATGLTLAISSTTTGALGTVSYTGGIAGTVGALLGSGGSITAAFDGMTDSITSRKSDYSDQIDRLQRSVDATQARLRSQFAKLETLLNQLKSQGSAFTSMVTGLTASKSG